MKHLRFCAAALLSLCLVPGQARAQIPPDSARIYHGAARQRWAKRPIELDSLLAMPLRAPAAVSTRAAPGPADLVLLGGRIFTGDAAAPLAEAVATRGETIAAVGTDAHVKPLTGPGTRVVPLGGKLAIPAIDIGAGGPVDPFVKIVLATTHPENPAEALTVERAVRAYTGASVYAELRAKGKGIIAPGFLADLAVLSKDIFAIPREQIPGTTSVLTIIGGKVVWEQPRDLAQTAMRHPK